MIAIFGAIGSALKIIQALLDPDKREKSFHLAMRKNAKKAMDLAEDIYDLVDDYLAGEIKEKSFKRKYKAMKRKFNDLD